MQSSDIYLSNPILSPSLPRSIPPLLTPHSSACLTQSWCCTFVKVKDAEVAGSKGIEKEMDGRGGVTDTHRAAHSPLTKTPPPQSGYHQAFVCGIYIHGCSETRIIWYDAQIEMIHRRWAGCRINRAENASLSVQWYEQLLRLNILFQLWWEASCRGGELKWADRRQRTILIAVSLPRSLSILSVCVPVLG